MTRIDLHDNEFMEKFVGTDHIDSNDTQFWYQLLTCSFNFTRVQDPKIVDKTLNPFIELLALNNSTSFNFGSLVRVTIDRASRIKPQSSNSVNPYYIYQTFNAIYLIRSVVKNYIENSSEETLIQSFRARVEAPQTNLSLPSAPQPPKHLLSYPQIPPPAVTLSAKPDLATAHEKPENSPHPPPSDVSKSDEPLQPAASIPAPQINDPDAIHKQPDAKSELTSGLQMLEHYLSMLIEIIVDFPSNESTYLLQVEAINSIIVLLSVQMYTNRKANNSKIYKCLMQKRCSIHALVLTKTLLNNFIRQDITPQESGSIIIGLASGLWKVLTLGYGGNNEDASEEVMPPLARQSLLLLNVLTNHYTTEHNPYREAIISCQDSRFNLSDPVTSFDNANNDLLLTASTSQSIMMSNSIKIEFSQLFDTICKHLYNDQVALLLYLLLHSNKIFKPYILTTAVAKLDQLVLPLLKILYSAIQPGSHHVYMVLIIFVILSEEVSFNQAIHTIILRGGIYWFKDRLLTEISLGSFTALIMIRSCQYNTFRLRDKFLHTNLFASLGNLSNYFLDLHPYVCQRMVDFLERLAKRYLALTKQTIKQPDDLADRRFIKASKIFDDPLARALATDGQRQDLQDASSIELDSTSNPNQGANNLAQNGNDAAININIPQMDYQHDGGQNHFLPPLDAHGRDYMVDSGQQSPRSSGSGGEHLNIPMDDASGVDVSLVEEMIRMLLEIISNSLVSQLESNPDLIYTLLYKKNLFNMLLSTHQSFYNMVINIERILTYFYNKIESYQRQLSVDEIKEIILETSREWNANYSVKDLEQQGQLLFRYVEDEQPEDFFIPYMWTKIYYVSDIHWNPKRIVLFNPELI